jgi:hypothetical protein
MHNIPAIIEDSPVVAVSSNMSLHNVILSPTTPTISRQSSTGSLLPVLLIPHSTASSRCFLGNSTPNGFGAEYAHADELHDAFWDATPQWRTWNGSKATTVFLEWSRFGLFMKTEWRPGTFDKEKKEGYWKCLTRCEQSISRSNPPL